jgi:hypothetical protein
LRLLSKTVTTAGKSALIVVGAFYGLLRGLRALGDVTQNTAGVGTLEARVDTMHLALARLAEQTEHLQTKFDRMVTKDELSQTLDEVLGQLERDVDARFEHQNRSAEALRMMVRQTDELLQRVLDGLKSRTTEDEGDAAGRPVNGTSAKPAAEKCSRKIPGR